MCGTSYDTYCLPAEKIDKQFHYEFITDGYRKPGISFADSIRSIFLPYCNETFNVWSHLLPGLYFAVMIWRLYTEGMMDITDPHVWPFLTLALSMVALCFGSAFAHTFNSMSPYAQHKCFYLDYAALNIFGMSFNQAYYFYSRPLDSEAILFKSPFFFLSVASFISVGGTYLSCKSMSAKLARFQYIIRSSTCSLSFIFASTTIFYRFVFCTSDVDCYSQSFALYWNHMKYWLIGVVVYAAKLPERLCVGMFNCIGSSHNLMHVFVAIGMYLQFDFIKSEFMNRKYRFVNEESISIAYTSLFFVTTSLILILLISYLIEPEVAEKCNETKKKE